MSDRPASAFVRTQGELADLLQVSRKTVATLLRTHTEAEPPVPRTRDDVRYDVPAWREFMRAHNIAGAGDELDDTEAAPNSLAHWKREAERLKCERLQIDIEKTRGSLVPVAELETSLGIMLAAFRTAANNLAQRAAPKLIGLRDYHDIEEVLTTELNIMLRTLEQCPFLSDTEASAGPSDTATATAS